MVRMVGMWKAKTGSCFPKIMDIFWYLATGTATLVLPRHCKCLLNSLSSGLQNLWSKSCKSHTKPTQIPNVGSVHVLKFRERNCLGLQMSEGRLFMEGLFQLETAWIWKFSRSICYCHDKMCKIIFFLNLPLFSAKNVQISKT